MASAFRNKFWNRANELWMSAALSNPKTQIINVVSTANNMFLRPAQSWVGSKLTWGMDDFTKAQMKEHGEDMTHENESRVTVEPKTEQEISPGDLVFLIEEHKKEIWEWKKGLLRL